MTKVINALEGVKNKANEATAIIEANEKKIPVLEEVLKSPSDKADELAETKKAAATIEAQLLRNEEETIPAEDYEIDPETGEILEDTREVLAMKAGNGTKNTEDSLEISHIKDQIRAHSDELNAMKSVVTVPIKKYPRGTFRTDIAKDIAAFFRKYGFKIKVNGLGEVTIDEKRIKNSLKYTAGNLAETSAYVALPEVLRNGIRIEEHSNHKDRRYPTITIAAPVNFINAKTAERIRGNVGVVVKQTTDNYYKVHRVLAPDGSVLKLNEADATYVEEKLNVSKSATITSASVTDNVTQPKKNGNQNQLGNSANPGEIAENRMK